MNLRTLRYFVAIADAGSLTAAAAAVSVAQPALTRQLRELEKPSRRLESAALELFALGRVRPHAETMATLAEVSATQVRDCFATMLDAGASVAVTGKLRRSPDDRVRSLAAPILKDRH